ncbi:hypothetical protein HT031_002331 [Scenedesmus sp. PABB004]|nr:hypothetical protein HT031_002331 [Scenedesmus sp. PABB004]
MPTATAPARHGRGAERRRGLGRHRARPTFGARRLAGAARSAGVRLAPARQAAAAAPQRPGAADAPAPASERPGGQGEPGAAPPPLELLSCEATDDGRCLAVRLRLGGTFTFGGSLSLLTDEAAAGGQPEPRGQRAQQGPAGGSAEWQRAAAAAAAAAASDAEAVAAAAAAAAVAAAEDAAAAAVRRILEQATQAGQRAAENLLAEPAQLSSPQQPLRVGAAATISPSPSVAAALALQELSGAPSQGGGVARGSATKPRGGRQGAQRRLDVAGAAGAAHPASRRPPRAELTPLLALLGRGHGAAAATQHGATGGQAQPPQRMVSAFAQFAAGELPPEQPRAQPADAEAGAAAAAAEPAARAVVVVSRARARKRDAAAVQSG